MKLFNRKDKSISLMDDYNQNSIIALLKGPDTQYKNILAKANEQLSVAINNEQYRDKNSFLQIHVRKLLYSRFINKRSVLDIPNPNHLSLDMSLYLCFKLSKTR